MSGQAGARGYLVQALIACLDALTIDSGWTFVTLEPNAASEKIDMLWQNAQRKKAVQVKSSENQISAPDVRKWAEELKQSSGADENVLRLIGPISRGVGEIKEHSGVQIPTPEVLNLSALVGQAAHCLDSYVRTRGWSSLTPKKREMIARALAMKLGELSTKGDPLSHADFDNMLQGWIEEIEPKEIKPAYEYRHFDKSVIAALRSKAQLQFNQLVLHEIETNKGLVEHAWVNKFPQQYWRRLRGINDYVFKCFEQIRYIQERHIADRRNTETESHPATYFQGLATMSDAPNWPQDGKVDLEYIPTGKSVSWRDVDYLDTQAPVQLVCDEYWSPSEVGYHVRAKVLIDGETWVNHMHIGPQTYRSPGNYQWTKEPPCTQI